MRKSRRSGFTLVEIMVVVIIIGILATLVITKVVGQGDKAKERTTRAMLTQIASSLDLFKMNHNRYPDNLEDLIVAPSYVKPTDWPPDGYIREYPNDGWGNKLVYRRGTSSVGKQYELMSYGADGKEGGDGLDADITY